MISLKEKYKGAVLTIRGGIQTGLPFDISFDTTKVRPDCYWNMYELGFQEAFNVEKNVGASEIMRTNAFGRIK